MKKLILFIFFGLSLTARSQCGTIQFDGVIPNPVYDTTHAYLNLHVSCNEMISLVNQNVTIVGSTIMVDAFYCYGWLQVITTTNDSIPLGVLPPGVYTYSVNVYSSYSPVTNCMAFNQTDYASGVFTVFPIVNSVKELSSELIHLSPNPATSILNIQSEVTIETIEISDVNGQLISVHNVFGQSTSLNLGNLTSGIYFIKLNASDSSIVKRIVIQ